MVDIWDILIYGSWYKSLFMIFVLVILSRMIYNILNNEFKTKKQWIN